MTRKYDTFVRQSPTPLPLLTEKHEPFTLVVGEIYRSYRTECDNG